MAQIKHFGRNPRTLHQRNYRLMAFASGPRGVRTRLTILPVDAEERCYYDHVFGQHGHVSTP
jgi:hypothetical protein